MKQRRYWLSRIQHRREWQWLEIVDGNKMVRHLNLIYGGEVALKNIIKEARYKFYEWKKESESTCYSEYKEIDENEAFLVILENEVKSRR